MLTRFRCSGIDLRISWTYLYECYTCGVVFRCGVCWIEPSTEASLRFSFFRDCSIWIGLLGRGLCRFGRLCDGYVGIRGCFGFVSIVLLCLPVPVVHSVVLVLCRTCRVLTALQFAETVVLISVDMW